MIEYYEVETAEKNSYTVKAGSFEGPLDLLLNLIESRKLFVGEISLAQVTDDYIRHMKSIPSTTLGDTTGFIIVAATLILIKSKSLLPNIDLTTEEEKDIFNLEDRLALYQKIKEIGDGIKKNFGLSPYFPLRERSWSDVIFTPDTHITPTSMHEAVKSVLQNMPLVKEALPEIAVKKVMSIDEMIESLTTRIQDSISTSFREFSGAGKGVHTKEEKVFVIVSFLAMLELVREGIIEVLQGEQFGDISLNKRDMTLESTLLDDEQPTIA